MTMSTARGTGYRYRLRIWWSAARARCACAAQMWDKKLVCLHPTQFSYYPSVDYVWVVGYSVARYWNTMILFDGVDKTLLISDDG